MWVHLDHWNWSGLLHDGIDIACDGGWSLVELGGMVGLDDALFVVLNLGRHFVTVIIHRVLLDDWLSGVVYRKWHLRHVRIWSGDLIAFLVLFPFLGASVLEPDFDLPFWESEILGQLGFPSDGDVATVVELFFQLEALMVAVHHSVFVLGASLT